MAARVPVETVWRFKGGVCKGPHRHAGQSWEHFQAVEDRDAANRTKVRVKPSTRIAHPAPCAGVALDAHSAIGKESGVAEGASRAPLAVQACAGVDDLRPPGCGDL